VHNPQVNQLLGLPAYKYEKR